MHARPNRFGFRVLLSARWPLLVVWLLAVVARSGVAQEKAADPGRTTMAGVYSAAQADKGQPKFEASCLGGCHNPASHRGAAFKTKWAGQSVWELYDKIHETMPDDDPGSLSAAESIALVAYVLKYNGVPAGKDDLPIDPDALRKIKIEFPPAGQKF
jgi:hypothetical protein